MTNWITKLAHSTNGRPLSQDETEMLVDYVETLPDRLLAAKKLEECQKWLVKHLSDYIAPRAIEWGLPKDPFATDFALCLTALVHSMVCSDKELLIAEVILPFCETADALEVPRNIFADLFDTAWHALCKRLDPRSLQLLEPSFTDVVLGLRITEEWSKATVESNIANAEKLLTPMEA